MNNQCCKKSAILPSSLFSEDHDGADEGRDCDFRERDDDDAFGVHWDGC